MFQIHSSRCNNRLMPLRRKQGSEKRLRARSDTQRSHWSTASRTIDHPGIGFPADNTVSQGESLLSIFDNSIQKIQHDSLGVRSRRQGQDAHGKPRGKLNQPPSSTAPIHHGSVGIQPASENPISRQAYPSCELRKWLKADMAFCQGTSDSKASFE